jgi:hypothetical protein
MKKQAELKKCKITHRKISPMSCAMCECEGCEIAEDAKEKNVGVAS